MKKMVLMMACVVLPLVTSAATTVPSSKVQLSPSSIDKVVRLVDKKEADSSYKKVQILVTDRGMSTGVSPRYSVYLAYSSLAEMGNIFADVVINENAIEFLSASRKAPGIYEVKVTEYHDGEMYEVTQEINATAIFVDEEKKRKECGDDFCDGALKTSVSITTKAKKIP